MLAAFWNGMEFNVFFVTSWGTLMFLIFLEKGFPKKKRSVRPVPSPFRPRSAGGVFEGTVAHVGTLLTPCW